MKKSDPLDWNSSASAAENVRERLPLVAERFFAAGTKAMKKGKPKKLHAFRLEVKRFRYTLEMFRPLYGRALDERLARLRRLQQHLGAINDCLVTRELILSAGAEGTLLARELGATLASRRKSATRRALAYWQEAFSDPDEQRRWVQYLKTFAGRAHRPPEPLRKPATVGSAVSADEIQ